MVLATLTNVEEAALGFLLGSGAGVGLTSTVPSGGEYSPAGAGAGTTSVEGEGGEDGVIPVVVFERWLLLSAKTITASFSLLTQLSLLPLMK